MKHISKITSLLPILFLMTSCNGSTLSASGYRIDKTTKQGYYYSRCDVTVTNGVISDAKIDQTYSPVVWSSLSEEQATQIGENNYVKFVDDDNVTHYNAKHIRIGDTVWTGTARDSEEEAGYCRAGEYICYSYDIVPSNEDYKSDFTKFIVVPDSGVYKLGEEIASYWDCVMNDKISILKEAEGYEIASSDGTGGNYVYDESGITPTFPNNAKVRSENPEASGWKRATDAFCSYLKGKKLNYHERFDTDDYHDTVKAKDGVWAYNPTLANCDGSDEAVAEADVEENLEKIEGCNVSDLGNDTLLSYFEACNIAFASVEYDSLN